MSCLLPCPSLHLPSWLSVSRSADQSWASEIGHVRANNRLACPRSYAARLISASAACGTMSRPIATRSGRWFVEELVRAQVVPVESFAKLNTSSFTPVLGRVIT
jgi:hypothetical protein